MSTDAPARILVVDDEENIRFLVGSALRRAGFQVAAAATGREALDLAATFRPDLLVLDVMLPDLDGFVILAELRKRGDTTPVIFLTARDATEDRVRGLTSGGADYQVKPFAVAELVARVRLRLEPGAGTTSPVLRCADLELDPDAHRVSRGGQPVHLSPTEYELLRFLLINRGRVLTREQILDHVWDGADDVELSVVDTYISYLRRKVDAHEPRLLHTVRGVGFALRAEP
jgi:two-component system OmpR family response regulator